MNLNLSINEITAHHNTKLWTKSAAGNLNIILKTLHEDNTFYLQILAKSNSNDTIIDDIHKINRPPFNDIEDRAMFYDYLRCLLQLTISDLKIMFDRINVVGPSGIINTKFNIIKDESEEYYFKNVDIFYNTIHTRFIGFLNDVLDMSSISNKGSICESVFENVDQHVCEMFGCSRLEFQPKRIKYGNLQIDMEKVFMVRRNKTSLFIPDEHTCEMYHIDSDRRIMIYKQMLDYYIKHGEEETRKNFIADIKYKVSSDSDENTWYLI